MNNHGAMVPKYSFTLEKIRKIIMEKFNTLSSDLVK